jgi:hypothetical protein
MYQGLDRLDLGRHRDLEGRGHEPWIRRIGLALLAGFLMLALANVFGQRQATSAATSPAASLSVSSPSRLRGGLLFTSRFTVLAHRTIARPTLVLDRGWFEQMTFNAIAPNPMSQSTQNGKVTLTFARMEAGQTLLVWISWQVDPTNVGRRSEDVALQDGPRRLAGIQRTITVYP